eukprot:gnl/TRDRNA2_/TRDRNA2_172396_c3_seq15.p1 gnl/TRDRNA2_/TRDRNA2_172396_c3~~gnl/TRDRNA2_/TRDRNA2_172396_c3_seq15.p1  ORF type:complete len:365 (+),score=72.41 gnl/TRDRNA2_/TRDRNA2_172396_c3_seq15:77-1096(+)
MDAAITELKNAGQEGQLSFRTSLTSLETELKKTLTENNLTLHKDGQQLDMCIADVLKLKEHRKSVQDSLQTLEAKMLESATFLENTMQSEVTIVRTDCADKLKAGAEFMRLLEEKLNKEMSRISSEQQACDSTLKNLIMEGNDEPRKELEVLRKRVVTLEQMSAFEQAVRRIESRGNIRMDNHSCRVELHLFKPKRFSPADMRQPVVAEFDGGDAPGPVMDDVMEVVKLFQDDVQVTVEGHTCTPTKAGTHVNLYEALAVDRARLVADELSKRGIDRMYLATTGRPGTFGLNRPVAVVWLSGRLKNENKHHQAALAVDAIPAPAIPPPASSGSTSWRLS